MQISWSSKLVKYGAIAGAIAAIGGAASWGWATVQPHVVSGPLPAASEPQVAQALQTALLQFE